MNHSARAGDFANLAGHRPARVNKQTVRLFLYLGLLLNDCVAILISFGFAGDFRNIAWQTSRGVAFGLGGDLPGPAWMTTDGVKLGLMVSVLYVVMGFRGRAFSMAALRDRPESIRRALSALFVTMFAIVMIAFLFHASELVSRFAFGSAIVGSGLLIAVGRYAFCSVVAGQHVDALVDELLIIDGVVISPQGCRHVLDAEAEGLRPDLRDPEMLAALAEYLLNFDRVVVACPPEKRADWSMVLKGANMIGEIVLVEGHPAGAIGLDRFKGHDTVIISRGPLDLANRAKKRALDLLVATTALIFLSPLLLVVAVAIKLESRGPVLFKQPRVGRGNRIFKILKFRSMRVETLDAAGSRSTQRDDDRITRVGRFIRKTSIDELPQLINVLLSDMSLVGPRPHALGSLAGDKLFWEVSERYWLRHALKPGITGLAQVRGFRGATHLQEDLERRLHADLEYINGWRLWRDITIIAETVKVVVHEKAY